MFQVLIWVTVIGLIVQLPSVLLGVGSVLVCLYFTFLCWGFLLVCICSFLLWLFSTGLGLAFWVYVGRKDIIPNPVVCLFNAVIGCVIMVYL